MRQFRFSYVIHVETVSSPASIFFSLSKLITHKFSFQTTFPWQKSVAKHWHWRLLPLVDAKQSQGLIERNSRNSTPKDLPENYMPSRVLFSASIYAASRNVSWPMVKWCKLAVSCYGNTTSLFFVCMRACESCCCKNNKLGTLGHKAVHFCKFCFYRNGSFHCAIRKRPRQLCVMCWQKFMAENSFTAGIFLYHS